MFYSTRSKLIASFLGVTLLVGAASLFIGGQLLYRAVLSEATNRVRLDLNAASEIYENRIESLKTALNITTLGLGFRTKLKRQDSQELFNRMRRVALHANLDFAGVTTSDGRTLCRIGPNSIPTEQSQPQNTIASLALDGPGIVAGTMILSKETLAAEDPELAYRANIRLLPTPRPR